MEKAVAPVFWFIMAVFAFYLVQKSRNKTYVIFVDDVLGDVILFILLFILGATAIGVPW
jgi:hypothetical protein